MQCHEFEQRLNDVLDERGEPAADPQLRAHAGDCDPCRQRLAGQRLLIANLRRYAAPPLPAEFGRRAVMAAIAPAAPLTRGRPASQMLLAAGTLLASAAAALLAISLLWYARSPGPRRMDQPTAGPPTIRDDNQVRPRWRSAGGTLAISQADLILEAPHIGHHLRDGLDGFAVAFPETVERYGEVERLAPGIRPLRLSFALFWDTLFRALPGVKDDSRPAHSKGGTSALFIDLARLA